MKKYEYGDCEGRIANFKAICPRCKHVEYWYDKESESPENMQSSHGITTVCPYDGAECHGAPTVKGEWFHNCKGCRANGIVDGRQQSQEEQEMDQMIK